MARVLVTLGSNIQPNTHLPAAVAALTHHPGLRLLSTSPTYVTPAVGADGQPSGQADFHNAAVLIETGLPPAQLVQLLRKLESSLGRRRSADKFAPRPIDLDIVLADGYLTDFDGRTLPDPDILRFPHVALPLADIAPDWVHPEVAKTLSQIAQDLKPIESEMKKL